MTNIRTWINLVEKIDKEREFYINQANEFRAEQKLWWPVSPELMDIYRDGSHSFKDAMSALHWYKNDQKHRDGDKPAEIYADGRLAWFKNGRHHRDGDKPAEIWADGTLVWYKNGELHRLRGPAFIDAHNKFQWYFKGKQIPVNSQEEYLQWLEKNGHVDVYRLRKS